MQQDAAGSPPSHTLPDGRVLVLGKAPPKQDPRTFKMARFIKDDLPALPDAIDYKTKVDPWPMFMNDQLGCCTIATVAHMTQLFAVLGSDPPVTPPDDEVLRYYEMVSGYDPKTGANDNGAIELDVLNLWRKNPFAGFSISGFASVDPKDEHMARAGVYLFGGLYIGIALPNSAKGQIGNQQAWDIAPDAGADAEPNSWGGHAVNVVSYDLNGLDIITWGKPQRMTWGFWHKYVDEAYAVLSDQWQDRTPAFDWNLLSHDLSDLGRLNPQH